MLHFDPVFLKITQVDEFVVFSCDDIYFQKFGIYNLLSCLQSNNNAHAHIINPTAETFKIIEKLLLKTGPVLSFSYELKDFSSYNHYQVKTYYYCSRFFIAAHLLENNIVKKAYITDADIIINKKIEFLESQKLGLMYNPQHTSLWKKISAPFIYIHTDRVNFLKEVINEYKTRFVSTDFTILEHIIDKHDRGNILGLDQVCLSYVFENKKFQDSSFININSISNFFSKRPNDGTIWILIKNKHSIDFTKLFTL